MSFGEAFQDSLAGGGNRHLLLGNGFSIACRPDCFRYERLLDEADFKGLTVAPEQLFGLSGTSDFERVIESLRATADIVDLYDASQAVLLDRVRQDAAVLKNILADVLSEKHPDNVGAIEAAEYESARTFLAHFPRNIYTVNYDLLLYWTLIQDLEPVIESDDGFRSDPNDPHADWVVWDGYAGHSQRIFHLHGGLHLYDAGSSMKKLTWTRTGIALIDQIRAALNDGIYPMVVTEGSSDEKLARIEHSPYLHRGLKSLTSCTGSLFVHGHSLAENDEHILQRIEQGRFDTAYVSLHGDPDSAANQAIRHRAELLVDRRNEHEAPKPANHRKPLRVAFYDADSADVWGG